MIEQTQKQENSLLNEISNLKLNKNPFSVFFILADLKDIFISIGENLLNSIELNYSRQAREQYMYIIKKYKDAGIFESLYNHYLHNNNLRKFKNEIDNYFEYSFFTDISFFFFTLSRSEKFKILFDLIQTFYLNKKKKEEYFLLETYLEKKDFLGLLSSDFLIINNDKDCFFIIKFLNNFKDFNFEEINISYKNSIPNNIKLIKKITLNIFQNKDKYNDLYKIFLEIFVYDKNIYDDLVERFEEKKLFEVILFLKNDIHSGIDYNFSLDYDMKNNIKDFLEISQKINFLNIEEKIGFLLNKENYFSSFGGQKGNFARINFKRKFLEKNYSDILDLILGIIDIPIEVFYLLKQQNLDINLENLKFYNEIKDLILYIDKSYFLNFTRPFLLKKISRYFNNSDQKYYIVKFILCVILSNSYIEYKSISKFFYNLESYHKKTLEAILSRIFQFGWVIITIGIISYFLPFGVFLAIFLYILIEIMVNFMSIIFPKIRLSLNFQSSTFLTLLAIFSIFLGYSIGYKDNVYLTYNYFKPIVNASILPTHESLKMIFGELEKLKANVIGVNEINYKYGPNFSDIDYLKGKELKELKEFKN